MRFETSKSVLSRLTSDTTAPESSFSLLSLVGRERSATAIDLRLSALSHSPCPTPQPVFLVTPMQGQSSSLELCRGKTREGLWGIVGATVINSSQRCPPVKLGASSFCPYGSQRTNKRTLLLREGHDQAFCEHGSSSRPPLWPHLGQASLEDLDVASAFPHKGLWGFGFSHRLCQRGCLAGAR